MDDYYYTRKLNRSAGSYKICMVSFIGIAIFVIIALLSSCRTKKVIEQDTTIDSTHVERSESIVYVPVTTYIEIPAQTASVETRDSTSHLETDFAWSDASIRWVEGIPFLNHLLANKARKIEHKDSVPTRQIRYTYYKTKNRTIYKTKILEKRLTLYQRAMLYVGPVFILLLIIIIFVQRLKC